MQEKTAYSRMNTDSYRFFEEEDFLRASVSLW